MGNILFQNSQQQNSSKNSVLNAIDNLKKIGPSEVVFNQMYNSNPAFKQFADTMRNSTPEQAFKQHGLDFNQFRNLHW